MAEPVVFAAVGRAFGRGVVRRLWNTLSHYLRCSGRTVGVSVPSSIAPRCRRCPVASGAGAGRLRTPPACGCVPGGCRGSSISGISRVAVLPGCPKLALAERADRSEHRQRVEAVKSWKTALLVTPFETCRKTGRASGFSGSAVGSKMPFFQFTTEGLLWLVEPSELLAYPGGCGSGCGERWLFHRLWNYHLRGCGCQLFHNLWNYCFGAAVGVKSGTVPLFVGAAVVRPGCRPDCGALRG
jgi:hypothetical protein